jgi:hypothetical protein
MPSQDSFAKSREFTAWDISGFALANLLFGEKYDYFL